MLATPRRRAMASPQAHMVVARRAAGLGAPWRIPRLQLAHAWGSTPRSIAVGRLSISCDQTKTTRLSCACEPSTGRDAPSIGRTGASRSRRGNQSRTLRRKSELETRSRSRPRPGSSRLAL